MFFTSMSSECGHTVPLRYHSGLLHMEGVQFLHAATADRHGRVGQPDGPALGPPRAAGGGASVVAGQGSAAAGPVAQGLRHAHLAVGELVRELVILEKR